MTIMLSKFVQKEQAEVIAKLLRADGALRLYEGEQPPLDVRTDGRLVSCKISSVEVEDGMLTIRWDSSQVTKEGRADYFRCTTGNIPVLSGSIPDELEMSDRELKVGTIIDAGMLIHSVFKV